MRPCSKILVIALLVVGAVLGGCGGSQDAPPAPLGTHFDDMYVASVPLDQKQPMVKSQNDWSLAKMENAKAEADFNESNTHLSIAQNDQKAAKLRVESAVASKKAAETSADTNRMNQAKGDLQKAEDLAKAADLRLRYIEVYREYLKSTQRYAQENMYWRESQYELAKAQLGQKNNIAPQGLAFDAFPKQEQDRAQRAGTAKSRAESAQARAMSARDTWRKSQEVADRETGIPTSFPDPMARSASSSR